MSVIGFIIGVALTLLGERLTGAKLWGWMIIALQGAIFVIYGTPIFLLFMLWIGFWHVRDCYPVRA